MSKYFHSVRLERDKCSGCTNCIKRCPTEAIRVQKGKAKIMDERCIDCGECIRVCPYHAKYALTDNLSAINMFKYKIALPAPTLYAQFKGQHDVEKILLGLKRMGFDDVYEVAKGAEVVSEALRRKLKQPGIAKPLISSACPAVVRLIQVRFPELVDNIVDIDAPVEVAAKLAKQEFSKKFNCREEDIGVYFITPCPAKMTSIKKPLGKEKSNIDGAISILDIYGLMAGQLKASMEQLDDGEEEFDRASAQGVSWARSGGECAAAGVINSLAVDGIADVIHALEDIENERLRHLDFFEGLACPGGCVGGPLVFESNYVSMMRLNSICDLLEKAPDSEEISALCDTNIAATDTPVEPLGAVLKLDNNIAEATRKLQLIKEMHEKLPGKDCGSCGSPTCRSLAEDIVLGYANELDCIFLMREKVRYLAEEMVGLASKEQK